MRTKRLRPLLYFYWQYFPVLLPLTVLCCVIYRANDGDIAAALLSKAATDALVWYFVRALHSKQLYYYYNLHVSGSILFTSLFIIDLLPFTFALWITHGLI